MTSGSGSPPSRSNRRRIVESGSARAAGATAQLTRLELGHEPDRAVEQPYEHEERRQRLAQRGQLAVAAWPRARRRPRAPSIEDGDDRIALADLALGDDLAESLPVVADGKVGGSGRTPPPDPARLRTRSTMPQASASARARLAARWLSPSASRTSRSVKGSWRAIRYACTRAMAGVTPHAAPISPHASASSMRMASAVWLARPRSTDRSLKASSARVGSTARGARTEAGIRAHNLLCQSSTGECVHWRGETAIGTVLELAGERARACDAAPRSRLERMPSRVPRSASSAMER